LTLLNKTLIIRLRKRIVKSNKLDLGGNYGR